MYDRTFYNKNLKLAARELRKSMTPAEKKIWYQFLRFCKPRAHRQRPMGNFIVDFYIPKKKLIIEVDGEYHMNEKDADRDNQRTLYFKSIGLSVIRITNDEITNYFESVIKLLERHGIRPDGGTENPLF